MRCAVILVFLLWFAGVPAGEVLGGEVAIERAGSAVRLTISGEAGKEYSVEAVEALLNQDKVWRPIATVAPNNGPVFLSDPTCSTSAQNFFRLRVLQGTTPVFVPNFRLIDLEGRAHELFYQSDATAVVLVLAGSDPASLEPVTPALKELIATLDPAKVRFWILVTATPANRAATRSKVSALGLNATVLEDDGGVVTRQLGRGSVPEVVVFHPATYSIAYRGRVDDQSIDGVTDANQPLLAMALDRLLQGQRTVVRDTEALGQPWQPPTYADRTYSADIAPLLERRCVKCHSPGNIAPWSMTNYAVVRDFAPLMKDEVITRRMPPWHADRRELAFSNDQMLSGGEMAMLVDWIDRGAPRGEGDDPLASNPPPAPLHWPLGTPDRVVAIQPQTIPATGTVDYRYLVIPNPHPTDVWLRAAAVRPGNPRVVHHVLIFSATSFSDILQIQAGLGGYFAAYVPGMEQTEFPEGTGKLLKRGAFLVFQMHYTTSGQPETDTTELGLYFASTTPERELRTSAAYTLEFTIPPGTPDHPATAEFRLPRDAWLHELSPHMHYRGKWFRFDAIYPDDRRETLLNVPFYRFDWQTLYRFAEPRRLPAGTRIVASGGWDNSSRNPFNPDPSTEVRFGEQSWEEMFIGYFNWSDAE